MRPLYIDINGTTDSKGNASIPVALGRMTGNWHNAKFTVGTTAPAEWAILVNGRPYTYGRGRRVTLGPELIQDGQTATVSVIGGPPSAVVDGTCTGKSGPADEIMASFAPAPNTIALDAFNISTQIGTFTNAGNGDTPPAQTIQVPGGTQGIGFAVNGVAPNQTPSAISITGGQTNLPYISMNSSTVVPAWATELFPEDTSIVCQVTGNAGAFPSITYIHAYTYNPRTRIQGSNSFLPVFVQNGSTPALWQAARAFVPFFQLNLAGGATATLVAAVAGQTVYLHDFDYAFDTSTATNWQLEDTAGTIVSYDAGTLVANKPYRFSGAPLATGRGVQIHNSGAAAQSIRGHLTYSQGVP